MTTTSATSSSATPDGTPAALADELTHALSLVSRSDRLKSAGDVGLLSRVVSMLCEVTIDNGTRTTIEAMLAELAPTVEEMRRCENHDELVVIFIRLRTQVVGRDGEIDRLLVLLAEVGERPVDREQHRCPIGVEEIAVDILGMVSGLAGQSRYKEVRSDLRPVGWFDVPGLFRFGYPWPWERFSGEVDADNLLGALRAPRNQGTATATV